jgi:macrolide-specific efflux system membrane fusion protein
MSVPSRSAIQGGQLTNGVRVGPTSRRPAREPSADTLLEFPTVARRPRVSFVPAARIVAQERTPPTAAPRRHRWLQWLMVLAIPVTIIAFLALRGGTKTAAAGPALRIVPVTAGSLRVQVKEVGRIEPTSQAQIRSRVGGLVKQVHVVEGERVQPDQPLITLDVEPFRREVMRLRAELAEQEAIAQTANKTLRRASKAVAVDVAPAAELDRAVGDARLMSARLTKARVALMHAEAEVSYTVVRAPFAGSVIRRNINAGELVVPGASATVEGKPLLVVADLSSLVVKIEVNQIDVAKLAVGLKAVVRVDALPERELSGVVTRIGSAAVTGVTGSDVFQVELKLRADQTPELVKPGMTAEVTIVVKEVADSVLVPVDAIIRQGGDRFVDHVVSRAPYQVVRKPVTLGLEDEMNAAVLAGLNAGDEVVVAVAPKSEK